MLVEVVCLAVEVVDVVVGFTVDKTAVVVSV